MLRSEAAEAHAAAQVEARRRVLARLLEQRPDAVRAAEASRQPRFPRAHRSSRI
jgi:hypothetical protein